MRKPHRKHLRHWFIDLSNRRFLFRRKMKKTFGKTTALSTRWFRFLSALLLGGIFFGYRISDSIHPWIAVIGVTAIFYVLMGLLIYGGKQVREQFRRFPTALIVVMGFFAYGVFRLLDGVEQKGNFSGWEIPVAVVALVLLEWGFSKGVGAVFYHRKWNGFSLLLLGITVVGNLWVAQFLFFTGEMSQSKRDFVQHAGAVHVSLKPEKYPVQVIDFGEEKKETRSLLSYVSYSGWTKKVRDTIWGDSLGKVPIAGRAYLPKNRENAPLFLFIHGNHRMTVKSHQGYDELGKYLASQGIAMVSLDENRLNGFFFWSLSGENDARAVLQLEGLKWLLEENQRPGSVFYEKFDRENIALGGHSRGGEAAALAATFNVLNSYPGNANLPFHYGFPIKGVVAVAPTYEQYKPGGKSNPLTNVNYQVIHGTHDGDVTNPEGRDQYHNAKPGPGREKSAILIPFANHSVFNELWGPADQESPKGRLYRLEDVMTGEEGQKILCSLVEPFLQRSFGNEGVDPDLPVYWEKSVGSTVVIDDFEEDLRPETATIPGGRHTGEGLYLYREERVGGNGKKPFGKNHGVELGWRGKASYAIELKEPVDMGRGLRFSVKNRENRPVEFALELTDARGNTAIVHTRQVHKFLPAAPVTLLKIDDLFRREERISSLETVEIPVEKFSGKSPDFQGDQVKEIKFSFNSGNSGHIYLDNVEFLR